MVMSVWQNEGTPRVIAEFNLGCMKSKPGIRKQVASCSLQESSCCEVPNFMKGGIIPSSYPFEICDLMKLDNLFFAWTFTWTLICIKAAPAYILRRGTSMAFRIKFNRMD